MTELQKHGPLAAIALLAAAAVLLAISGTQTAPRGADLFQPGLRRPGADV